MAIYSDKNDLLKVFENLHLQSLEKHDKKITTLSPPKEDYLFYDYLISFLNEEDENKVTSTLKVPKNTDSPIISESDNELSSDQTKISKTRNANKNRIHWTDSDKIDPNYINTLIVPKKIKDSTPAKSLLSDLIQQDIIKKSFFYSYSSVGYIADDSASNVTFSIHVLFNQCSPDDTVKTITVKDNTTVQQMVGYTLFLCQVEDFMLNINKDINSYFLYKEEKSGTGSALSFGSSSKLIKSNELFLKYEVKDIMADIIFYVKTSRSTQSSKNYTLTLNNNFKNIIIQYLQSKKLKSDGGYDVYLKRNKTYVKDLDVSMLTLKDELDSNGQLEVEIVYYDLSTSNDLNLQSRSVFSFDIFRHVSLISTLTASDVHVIFEGNVIEIEPVSSRKSIFVKTKSVIINMADLTDCYVKHIKSSKRKQLKIKYTEGSIKKSVVIESFSYDIGEIKRKINDYISLFKNP